ncbi:MAG TPA: SDR family NAD(P)-dependent oxidoreductase [Solirubrobacteraceae bacterium]|nr:SDR family NAD(P)-dependent oxidoreductase [Solirubrobacteraceae bacterium]
MSSKPVALVTGANRGLGRAVAAALAQRGARVLLGARDLERGREAQRELAAAAIAVTPVKLDVTDAASVLACSKRLADEHGRLDILINNAGVLIETPSAKLTAASMAETFDVNVFGVVTVTTALLPLLSASSSPRIVNVTSRLGSLSLASAERTFTNDAGQVVAYSASKAALNMLTIGFAQAFASDPQLSHIKVNAATPGYTATNMTDHHGRSPQEGAKIIVELAMLGDDGPTGGFFNDEGPLPW